MAWKPTYSDCYPIGSIVYNIPRLEGVGGVYPGDSKMVVCGFSSAKGYDLHGVQDSSPIITGVPDKVLLSEDERQKYICLLKLLDDEAAYREKATVTIYILGVVLTLSVFLVGFMLHAGLLLSASISALVIAILMFAKSVVCDIEESNLDLPMWVKHETSLISMECVLSYEVVENSDMFF